MRQSYLNSDGLQGARQLRPFVSSEKCGKWSSQLPQKTIPNYKFCMSISPDFTLRDEN